MRILKPEIAKAREEKILRMIIQEYVQTKRPVGSELVAQKALADLSSATIRNTMKKLEEEGYLYQPYASGGRIPTDKAYRFYVDYLSKVQKVALKERQRIEREYRQSTEEINRVMAQTCKMLSMLTHTAGFVFRPSIKESRLQRLDFIPLGPCNILAVLVTEEGIVRHWSVRLNYLMNPAHVMLLNNFINERICGLTFEDAKRGLWESMQSGRGEVESFCELALKILDEMSTVNGAEEDQLYIDGISRLAQGEYIGEQSDLSRMMSVIEERDKFAQYLGEKMLQIKEKGAFGKVNVSIGSENELAELKNLSVITSAYETGDKTVGLLGIVGPKHMEYSKMMSLVDFVGQMLSTTIKNWQASVETKERDDDEKKGF